jgi:hypothetical protein
VDAAPEVGETIDGVDLDGPGEPEAPDGPYPLPDEPGPAAAAVPLVGALPDQPYVRPRGKYDAVVEDSQRPDEALLVDRLDARGIPVAATTEQQTEVDEPGGVDAPDAVSAVPQPVSADPGEQPAPPPAAAPIEAAVLPTGVIDAVPSFADVAAPPPHAGPGVTPAPAPTVLATPVTAHPFGALRLTSGDAVPLDKPVVVGRAPSPPAGRDRNQVHLIRMAEPDISGNHVTFSPESGHLLVTDVSRNGTYVVQPGRAPERLRKDEPMPIPPSSRVYLNEHVFLTYEGP